MWHFDSMFGKTKTYFARAAELEHSDDDEFVIWHLLGFEFLLRSPLARIHPSLLAAPEGDSILSANGVLTASEPKSVPTHTVVSRLMQIVPDFTKERQQDSTTLLNLRNAELHTGGAAVGNVSNEFWLPKLLRVAEVICDFLEVQLEDVLADDVVELGRSLVDLEDKKLAHEVQTKIDGAKEFVLRLSAEEIAGRLPPKPQIFWVTQHTAKCPACDSEIPINLEQVRTTGERLVDDCVVRDVVYVATSFSCPVCTLELISTAEIVAAGLPQQFTDQESEDLGDRFQQDIMDDGYGND